MCSTGPFQYRWLKGYVYSSCYYHHQTEISTFPIVIIFFRGCVPEMFVTSYSVTYCIYVPENREFFFSLLLCNLWWVQIVGYVLPCRLYSFVCTVHHLIIVIVQNYPKTLNLWNACQIYFVDCVSKIKHILPVINYTIHYTLCGAVCFQFSHSPCVDWENIYTLSYYHHQIGSTNYYALFRVRS